MRSSVHVFNLEFNVPFGFGGNKPKYDQQVLDSLREISSEKNRLPEHLRGIANALGLYVQNGDDGYSIAGGTSTTTSVEFLHQDDVHKARPENPRRWDRVAKPIVQKYEGGDWEPLVAPTQELLEWVSLLRFRAGDEILDSDEFLSNVRLAIDHFHTSRQFQEGFFEELEMSDWLVENMLGEREFQIIDKLRAIGEFNEIIPDMRSREFQPADNLWLKVRRDEQGDISVRYATAAPQYPVRFSPNDLRKSTPKNPKGYQISRYSKGDWEELVEPTYQLMLWLQKHDLNLEREDDKRRLDTVSKLFEKGLSADSDIVSSI